MLWSSKKLWPKLQKELLRRQRYISQTLWETGEIECCVTSISKIFNKKVVNKCITSKIQIFFIFIWITQLLIANPTVITMQCTKKTICHLLVSLETLQFKAVTNCSQYENKRSMCNFTCWRAKSLLIKLLYKFCRRVLQATIHFHWY